jgi:hypothetical protein
MSAPATTWAPVGPSKYGMSPGVTSAPPMTELSSVASPSKAAQAAGSPLNPDNPLFWFGVIGAVTFGLMAFSTSVRVGGTTASLNLGDTK